MNNIPISVTILPIMGIPEFVQVRILGQGIDLCIEGTRTDALTVAFEELMTEGHQFLVQETYDHSA